MRPMGRWPREHVHILGLPHTTPEGRNVGPLQMAPRGLEFTSGVKVRPLSFGTAWAPTSVEHTRCAVPSWASHEVEIEIKGHRSCGSLQQAVQARCSRKAGLASGGQSGGLPTTTPTLTDLGTWAKLGSCRTSLSLSPSGITRKKVTSQSLCLPPHGKSCLSWLCLPC